MFNKKLFQIMVGCLLIAILISSAVFAKDKVRSMDIVAAWGENPDPSSHPESAYFNEFKSAVESLSNGKMKVKLNAAGSLGTAPQMLDFVARNSVQIVGSMPVGVVASKYCPSMNALLIPYLFKDPDITAKVMSSPKILSYMNQKLRKNPGIEIISIEREGIRAITNSKRPLHSPSDLKGLKIRVMEGEIYSNIYKAMGASPVPVSWSELYTSLQTKIVDGQDNPPSNIVYATLYECQKYLTYPGPLTAINTHYINAKWFSSLTSEEKKIIVAADKRACEAHRSLVDKKNDEAMEFLKTKMEVYILNDTEYNDFRKVVQPYVMKSINQLTGGDQKFVDMLQKEVKKVEKAQSTK